jgi:hypothetical protein
MQALKQTENSFMTGMYQPHLELGAQFGVQSIHNSHPHFLAPDFSLVHPAVPPVGF